MRACLVPFCGHSSNKPKENLQFFKVTKSRHVAWMLALGRDPEAPLYTTAAVCSDHFLPDDFITIFGRRSIKEGAVPTVNLRPNLLLYSKGSSLQSAAIPKYYIVPCSSGMPSQDRSVSMNLFMEQPTTDPLAIGPDDIETYEIPDSPVSTPEPPVDSLTSKEPEISIDKEFEEEDIIYESINADLDKQNTLDMEAIQKYINRTEEDSISKRVEFFNNMDNTYINKCKDRNVSNHILYQHTAMGTLKWHECTMCDYRTTEKEKLREHTDIKHSSDSAMLGCLYCNFKSRHNTDLLRHLKVVHQKGGDRELLKCDKCDDSFTKNFDLLRHKKQEHGLVVYVCDKCDFATIEQGELTKHKLMEHLRLNVSWYKCAKCAYRTAKKINLDRHIMYKHSEF